MSNDIESILSGEQESTGDTEAAERLRDEKGRFAKADAEPVAEAPVEAEPEEQPEPVKAEEPKPKEDAYKTAMLEERRKRQEIEARLRAYEQAKNLPEPPPFWDNPEQAIDSRIERVRTELQQDYLNRYYNALEAAARGRHPDYDEVRDVFIEQARQNPALAHQMNSHPDPAEYAYQQGKLLRELSTVGNDIDAYRKRVEAEVRARIEAEMRAKQPQVPRSLNSEPSAPVQGNGQWEPAPLESLMGLKF